MTTMATHWLEGAIEHLRGLNNVQHVEPMCWMDDEFLVYVTPTPPLEAAGGGWAQPTEPLYLLLSRDGWRVAPVHLQ